MVLKFFKNFFGSKNDRLLKKYSIFLDLINSFESKFVVLSDNDLKYEFKKLRSYSSNDLNQLLPLSYSIVREVAKRVLNMRPFDVQILGGIALFYNKVTEISTGEGKTLVATLPVCLNFLLRRSVHVITVNDYLAYRDANWMKPIYTFLGLSVGVIHSNMSVSIKKEAYLSDVVYGTCNEFGFDYLRDNIVFSSDEKVQSKLDFAILDEVDCILIDESRTPLIISLPEKSDSSHYILINSLITKLSDSVNNSPDYILDYESKNVYLTDIGFQKIENLFIKHNLINSVSGLYDGSNIELLYVVYAVLKAKFFFKRDVDYIVDNFEILIIDENTGRIMHGRRWGDGLHQAIEAKEGLQVKSDNQTLASITFQNFFRLYDNLSGMTGTAVTESLEFETIYNLEVVVIPTNKANIRIDNPDIIFLTKHVKYKFILKDIKDCYLRGQPVLVGTVSIDVSEFISELLHKNNVKHSVLNAKYHDKESAIIAEAGRFKSVTISTNMAGRGTDIVLGGFNKDFNFKLDYEKIISLGGLKVIGTERHESRRIDNQLRGRCARQGDPGCTQFYVSLEDDLIKIFIGDTILSFLNKFNLAENDVISNSFVTKSIENAQHKVESHNFDIRKQLLEYDDIINEQRKVFYQYRDSIILCVNMSVFIEDIFSDIIDSYFLDFAHQNLNILLDKFNLDFGLNFIIDIDIKQQLDYQIFKSFLLDKLFSFYNFKKSSCKLFDFNIFERSLFLNILDLKWRDHLVNLDYLRKGIYLRGYAQKDPKEEYKKEAFVLFKSMLYNIKHDFLVNFFRIPFEKMSDKFFSDFDYKELKFIHNSNSVSYDKKSPFVKKGFKIGRNDLCYCKSNRKYKHCHGKNF